MTLGKGKVILLVEDNEQDELLTLRALRKANIQNEVFVVRDGAEAVDYLLRQNTFAHLKNEELPQVVLLDLKLPKLDGFEVLKRVRGNASTRWLPIVILTTSKEDSDLLAGYESGANSYVLKPVDFTQFSEAVKNLGLYWLLINEAPRMKD